MIKYQIQANNLMKYKKMYNNHKEKNYKNIADNKYDIEVECFSIENFEENEEEIDYDACDIISHIEDFKYIEKEKFIQYNKNLKNIELIHKKDDDIIIIKNWLLDCNYNNYNVSINYNKENIYDFIEDVPFPDLIFNFYNHYANLVNSGQKKEKALLESETYLHIVLFNLSHNWKGNSYDDKSLEFLKQIISECYSNPSLFMTKFFVKNKLMNKQLMDLICKLQIPLIKTKELEFFFNNAKHTIEKKEIAENLLLLQKANVISLTDILFIIGKNFQKKSQSYLVKLIDEAIIKLGFPYIYNKKFIENLPLKYVLGFFIRTKNDITYNQENLILLLKIISSEMSNYVAMSKSLIKEIIQDLSNESLNTAYDSFNNDVNSNMLKIIKKELENRIIFKIKTDSSFNGSLQKRGFLYNFINRKYINRKIITVEKTEEESIINYSLDKIRFFSKSTNLNKRVTNQLQEMLSIYDKNIEIFNFEQRIVIDKVLELFSSNLNSTVLFNSLSEKESIESVESLIYAQSSDILKKLNEIINKYKQENKTLELNNINIRGNTINSLMNDL